jgi:cytochrome c oxidase cbb3-type subunit 3
MVDKVPFRVIAIGFLIVFSAFAGVLVYYMSHSVKDSAAITANELKKARDAGIPTSANAAEAQELGRLLFINQCAGCHGSNGQGGQGKSGPSLIRPDWTFDRDNVRYIVGRIKTGNPALGMPAFSGRLRDDDIGRLVATIEMMNQSAQEH